MEGRLKNYLSTTLVLQELRKLRAALPIGHNK